MFTEESLAGIEDIGHDDVEEDLRIFHDLLTLPHTDWEVGYHSSNFKIYRRKERYGPFITVRSQILLPKVPKHIAFKAFSDINLRQKWDPSY